MPEVQNTPRVAAQVTGAIDDIGLAVAYRFEHLKIIQGVIFRIRILNADIISAGMLKTGSQSRAFTHIAGLDEHNHFPVFGGESRGHIEACIRGTVVHNHKFQANAVPLQQKTSFDAGSQCFFLIEARYYKTEYFLAVHGC